MALHLNRLEVVKSLNRANTLTKSSVMNRTEEEYMHRVALTHRIISFEKEAKSLKLWVVVPHEHGETLVWRRRVQLVPLAVKKHQPEGRDGLVERHEQANGDAELFVRGLITVDVRVDAQKARADLRQRLTIERLKLHHRARWQHQVSQEEEHRRVLGDQMTVVTTYRCNGQP